MVNFSKSLIEEYKNEMTATYHTAVSDADAQIQLNSLVRALFPVFREKGLTRKDEFPEVGVSITPTSGHWDRKHE